jgi:hypothetical protein
MSWKTIGSLMLVVALASAFLPAAARAEICSCNSGIFYLEAEVQGATCPPLTSALIYALNTQSNDDCINRGYDRSCADSATLHDCTLVNGVVHKDGFISYRCAHCFPGPDGPQG